MAVTEKTRINVGLLTTAGALIALVSGCIGATANAYAMRDKALADIQATVRSAVAEETAARSEQFRHYVTREEWLEWRQSEGAKRDQQFFELRELILRRK